MNALKTMRHLDRAERAVAEAAAVIARGTSVINARYARIAELNRDRTRPALTGFALVLETEPVTARAIAALDSID